MPWLLAARRKKLLHQHLLLKLLLPLLPLLKLLLLHLLLRPLTLLLLLLTPPSRLTLLLLPTLPSQLKPRQNNHQIIFKKPVSRPVFFRPRLSPASPLQPSCCYAHIPIANRAICESPLRLNRTALAR
ncbi:hypothetical protein HDC89_002111 [Herbaspirillum sp. SJZ102]|nr:hypothetical protein [Herbaspirillum sp. SJZ102]TWC71301.1 hypothetical protein FB597_101271 [Herbaspirillum sp. SJZ099]